MFDSLCIYPAYPDEIVKVHFNYHVLDVDFGFLKHAVA